jgi:hypothetical protein
MVDKFHKNVKNKLIKVKKKKIYNKNKHLKKRIANQKYIKMKIK